MDDELRDPAGRAQWIERRRRAGDLRETLADLARLQGHTALASRVEKLVAAVPCPRCAAPIAAYEVLCARDGPSRLD